MSKNKKEVHLFPFEPKPVLKKSLTGTDWTHEYYKIKEAHAKGYTGKGVKIAVLDDGLTLGHPAFKKAREEGRVRSLDVRRNGKNPDSKGGHGNHVSSVIIGSDGVKGFAPDLELLLSLKVLNDNGTGSISNIERGVDIAIAEGVDIITSSLGWNNEADFFHPVVKKAEQAGVIWTSAAGNDGTKEGIDWPGLYDYIISVGSHNDRGVRDLFSDFGVDLDLYGPGSNVLGAFRNSGYALLDGTSMATPKVAAIIAIFLKDLRQKYGIVNREIFKKLATCH